MGISPRDQLTRRFNHHRILFLLQIFLNIVTSLALLIVALGVSNDGTFVDWSGYKMLCSQPSGAGHPPV